MSKAGKDKKTQSSSQIEKLFDAQKRNIIDYEFTIRQLQNKLIEKKLQNDRLTEQLNQQRLKDTQTIHILTLKTEEDSQVLKSLIAKNADLDYQISVLISEKKLFEELLNQQKMNRQTEVESLKSKADIESKILQKEIEDLKQLDINKFIQELTNLKDQLQQERTDKTRELADKQREKVQMTDKLRDGKCKNIAEMMMKVREMRTNLLSLKKEQLTTTTRLTLLQNHQLTSQLEYQSKETEKLVFKEDELLQKIRNLQQELAVGKDVEKELAKRVHFSKGHIQKLNEKIADLQMKLEQKNQKNMKQNANEESKPKSRPEFEIQDESNEILIQIERQLSITQMKLSEAQSRLLATEKQKDMFLALIKKQQISCNDLAKVLIRYSQEIGDKQSQIQLSLQTNDYTVKMDLKELRKKKIEEWSQQEITTMVKIMLNFLKPYLTKKNLIIPQIRHLLTIQDTPIPKIQSKLPLIDVNYNDSINTNTGTARILKNIPISLASKIVTSPLREWGSGVNMSAKEAMKKKFKITQSFR